MTRSFFAALLGSIALVFCGAPASAQNAYIPSGNTVSVIHTPTSTLGAPIPVSAPTTGWVAVSPAGRKVYVGTGNAVSVIDALANAVVATIPIGSPTGSLVLGPHGRRLYVGTGNGVLVIETDTGRVIGTLPGDGVISPDGSTFYVAQEPNTISAFDTETYALKDTITVQPLSCNTGIYPMSECAFFINNGPAISPDGNTIYVAYQWSVGSFRGGALAAIDTATNRQSDITSISTSYWAGFSNLI